jgi:hypothetical protein
MPTRKLLRKQPGKPSLVARRPVPRPRFTRVRGHLKLVVPADCSVSVILKLVDHDDDNRTYAWWMLVGRYNQDTLSVSYKFTGEDTIRCDIPEGMPLSVKVLERRLAVFLDDEDLEEGKPPIIRITK